MNILGIDPGTYRSAWLLLVDGRPTAFRKEANESLVVMLRHESQLGELLGLALLVRPDVLVIEEVTSYGNRPIGRETFATMAWAGRFAEALHPTPVAWLPRGTVARQLGARGDAGIRAALIDRWGGKDAAIGRKASPGPLYGIAADVWSALALATAYQEGAR